MNPTFNKSFNTSLNPPLAPTLTPAIIQDNKTNQILMLGYMSPESLRLTQETGKVTFFSRSRQSLWVKGETSGNYLEVVEIKSDCDQDALLIRVNPLGPTCHRETPSCFDHPIDFLNTLETLIHSRLRDKPPGSYISKLSDAGLDRIAQKVGEESIETVIAAKNTDQEAFENESADLLFHLMVLLQSRRTTLVNIVNRLKSRHKENFTSSN